LKSRKELLSFEESKALLYLLCDLCKIPVPAVRKIDSVGYLGEQYGLDVFLREENSFETVVHEWMHYVFTLCYLERLHWQDREDDSMEHRVIMFLESVLEEHAAKLYKSMVKKVTGSK